MKEKKKLEIEELISKLDLTPIMHQYAVERYESLKDYLKSVDESIIFHPHGSFMLGTTVRPYKEQMERSFDLDSICLFNKQSNQTKPITIRKDLETMLESNANYNSKLDYDDRCITINYAGYGTLDFNIDVVPSAIASDETKQEMMKRGCLLEYVNTAIEVAEVKDNDKSKWISSNPQAYVKWFNDINQPFADTSRKSKKQRIFESNRNLYNTEEDVPEYFNKSSLQMAIQLLKRARDVFFSKKGKEKENLKPISAIISTIVMDIAKNGMIPYDADVMEVVAIVIQEMKTYSEYQRLTEEDFRTRYFSKVTISKKNNHWEMWNPVNPKDNLVDRWNETPECATLFFEWVSSLERTIAEIFDENNVEYTRSIGNMMGQRIVEDYYSNLKKPPVIDGGPRPWKLQ